MEKIHKIVKKYNLKVIEDSADTIGYTVNKKNVGKLSDITTNSFYASHIINGAGSGGIACLMTIIYINMQNYLEVGEGLLQLSMNLKN